MKRYPVILPLLADGSPSALLVAKQAILVPGAPFPYGLGDPLAPYCYYTEEQVRERPELLKLCGEAVELEEAR